MSTTVRTPQEATFLTHDGVELFYRHWPAASGAPKGAILLFHRGHEHSGRVAHLADELALPDYAIFAWDARGHGRSPGARGYSPGVDASVRDIQTFADHITDAHGIAVEDMAVVAQSVGAVLAATWVHDYAPRIRALVLASPAFAVKLYVPFARPGLRLMQRLRGDFYVTSYVKAQFLTKDPARRATYATDPLITPPISVNMLLGLHDTGARIVADAGAIRTPTQLLISGKDFVVEHGPQHRFFENLGSVTKERHILPGFLHDTLGESDRAPVLEKVRGFIEARFAEPAVAPGTVDADRIGFTRDEMDRLASPVPTLSPRGLYWASSRLNLALGGMLSKGIRLGHATGFDSGSTLDYVYENEARGAGPVGRLVDRTYLDAIGWRGIRQRKLNLQELIGDAMRRLQAENLPVRVMDIAAGHGRYVLDAIAKSPVEAHSILLRDYSDLNVEAGARLIAGRGLDKIARFERGDAFDAASLASVEPKPTLGIVSGLYELFPNNALVGRSLSGLGEAIAPGGYLVYTGQPWHPQLEFIARVLTSHRGGDAWLMRRRTQGEMDALVEAAGFRKVAQRIDPWGIFTVSIARRIAT
jgi:alpha-beta hydrolase superfamily lysophospholipase